MSKKMSDLNNFVGTQMGNFVFDLSFIKLNMLGDFHIIVRNPFAIIQNHEELREALEEFEQKQ